MAVGYVQPELKKASKASLARDVRLHHLDGLCDTTDIEKKVVPNISDTYLWNFYSFQYCFW